MHAEKYFKRQMHQGHSYFDRFERDEHDPLKVWSYPIHKWVRRGAPLSVIKCIVEKVSEFVRACESGEI